MAEFYKNNSESHVVINFSDKLDEIQT